MSQQIKVALVGMGFGAEFVPIYQSHPLVSELVIADTDKGALESAATKFRVGRAYTSLEEVLADGSIDAVHLVTPVNLHASQSVQVLKSGKHCACTIPMGMSLEEIEAIIAAVASSGKQYMMMETSVYTREYLYVKELYNAGKMGKIQFMRCAHYQDMEGWPDYWKGFPPLMHPTHAVAPCLELAAARPQKVFAVGSGSLREELVRCYGSPFAFESAFLMLEDSDTKIEMSRFLFETARDYTESFHVYASRASFEWQQIEAEKPVLFEMGETGGKRGTQIHTRRLDIPDYAHLLPSEIAPFTKQHVYDNEETHLSFLQGGGHGGSHPHLVQEFVSAIVENRPNAIDHIRSAYWTGVGICAHQSAMAGGAVVEVPHFEKMDSKSRKTS